MSFTGVSLIVPFESPHNHRTETVKAAPKPKKPVSEDSFKGSPQAQAGRQLSKIALLPVLQTVS